MMFLSFIITNFLLALAAEETRWWDYPGFELWKFVNLAIFVIALVFAMRKFFGVPAMFRDRKETIKRELAKAQEERDAALQKLKEVEARLGLLDKEVASIKEQSVREAAEERERIAHSTEAEIVKLSEQAAREIESAGKAARKELRRYTAEQSVRLAEEIVRREMKPEDDARLIASNIEELGGPAQ
jgi:F0F1-type ATP synthase membrane subunit b/b'